MMSNTDRFAVKVLVVWAVVLALVCSFPAFGQSLEVRTVKGITPQGVVLTDAGCYEYGSLVASLASARQQGIRRSMYDEHLRSHPAKDHQPEMALFIGSVIDAVYAWPNHMYSGKPLSVKIKYTEDCRKVKGNTWLLALLQAT
jgi:hypothetical protein